MATRKKAAKLTDDSIRNLPEPEALEQKKKEDALAGSATQVKAITTHGRQMYDPQHKQYITGDRPCLVTQSNWLRDQVAAGKIKILE